MMTKPICTVMVGLPGLGKSTLIERMNKSEAFIYSTDTEIERRCAVNGWTYDQGFINFIEPATKYMNEQLDIAVRSRQDIIWDQTNLGVGKRRKIINRMKQAGYQVRCVCIVPAASNSIAESRWKCRLANRPGKTIPQNILTNMIESFTMPTLDEGFDMITFYDMNGNLVDNGEN